MINHKRRFLVIVGGAFVLVGLWCLLVCLVFFRMPLIADDQGLKYEIPIGKSIHSVVNDLHAKNILQHPLVFDFFVAIKGLKHHLKAGEYLFPKGSTANSILMQITTGKGIFYHTFTIVPGWTFQQVRATLARDDSVQHVTQQLSDAEVMARLGYPNLHPEGEFFPDTYYFVKNTSDLFLLKIAFLRMQKKLTAAWMKRDLNLPFQTPLQALTAASLIEKEAFLDKERPMIAGVLVNRLRKNMLLQFDPTVIYGMGARYTGKIYKTDLTTDTPYNTYVRKGLPPTPIAMPSLKSINAVMQPQQHNYYYFVAKGDGSHQFSDTLVEHHGAVKAAKYYDVDFLSYYYLPANKTKVNAKPSRNKQ